MNDGLRSGLMRAADAIGAANWGRITHVRKVRIMKGLEQCPVSLIHRTIVEALNGNWSDEQAASLLHCYQHDVERWGNGR